MPNPEYPQFVSALEERYGDDLRWIASFDSESFAYNVRYVREDLKTDLSDRDLQIIIHRSMAVFNRRHVEDVYSHLGDAQSLVVQHEEATAVHLYLDDRTGVVVKLAAGARVELPTFREEYLDLLYGRR
ncbi:hypothetical protein DMJ13_08325 [halophilic archaeon]|nr:hypothetical protein DMJ13_08325 [halophilic archaeon]